MFERNCNVIGKCSIGSAYEKGDSEATMRHRTTHGHSRSPEE